MPAPLISTSTSTGPGHESAGQGDGSGFPTVIVASPSGPIAGYVFGTDHDASFEGTYSVVVVIGPIGDVPVLRTTTFPRKNSHVCPMPANSSEALNGTPASCTQELERMSASPPPSCGRGIVSPVESAIASCRASCTTTSSPPSSELAPTAPALPHAAARTGHTLPQRRGAANIENRCPGALAERWKFGTSSRGTISMQENSTAEGAEQRAP
jgi:hypothetical protein